MHMSWVSGVPTLALFGSSRGDWSRPLGPRSLCLDSSDLECRFCMEEECRYGDVRCLTRRDPREVAELAFRLMTSMSS
jgi:ADP-heptose:LPS heptosyltransferase